MSEIELRQRNLLPKPAERECEVPNGPGCVPRTAKKELEFS